MWHSFHTNSKSLHPEELFDPQRVVYAVWDAVCHLSPHLSPKHQAQILRVQ